MRTDPPASAVPRSPRLRSFVRECRGSASVELAIGASVLIAIAALCFDLYARMNADTAGARAAVVMAEYVSMDPTPDGDALDALGRFLHAHELRVPADVVYVLTALRRSPEAVGNRPQAATEVLWIDDSIRIGDETVTGKLAKRCTRFTGGEGDARLPDGFTMASGEVFVIVEVCGRLTREGSITGRFVSGDLYRHHALPVRDPEQPPAAPAHAEGAGDGEPVAIRSTRPPTGNGGVIGVADLPLVESA